jgi:hypothetical protein
LIPEMPAEYPWASATFEGNELEQLRRWAKIPFEKKLEWLEEAYKISKALQDSRLAQGGPATVRGNGQIENLR